MYGKDDMLVALSFVMATEVEDFDERRLFALPMIDLLLENDDER